MRRRTHRVRDAGEELFTRRAGRCGRRRGGEDRLDPAVERFVRVEDRGAVEQADAADGAAQDLVVVGRGGQRADEREQRIAGIATADVERLAAPTGGTRRIGRAGQRVALARLRPGLRAKAFGDRRGRLGGGVGRSRRTSGCRPGRR
jgi:hypothetical protein